MAIGEHKSWRELCRAALEAKDPNELLQIVQELNKALKDEEQVRRDFREATRANKSPGRSDINNYRRERERTKRHFKPRERILRPLRNGKDGRINEWLSNAGCRSPYLAGELVVEVQSAEGQ